MTNQHDQNSEQQDALAEAAKRRKHEVETRDAFFRLCGYNPNNPPQEMRARWYALIVARSGQYDDLAFRWGYEPAFVARCLWEQDIEGIDPKAPFDQAPDPKPIILKPSTGRR